jgi:DNA-directed RNA polymerase sigma subunit (sigma70/sigma32)
MVGGREQSLGEIGLKLGLSRERIRQIQQDALRKLSVDPEVREMGTGARPYGTPSLEASQLQA